MNAITDIQGVSLGANIISHVMVGNAMEPRIHAGDVVFFDPAKPLAGDNIYLVRRNEGPLQEPFIVCLQSVGRGRLRMSHANQTYPADEVDTDYLTIVGSYVGRLTRR